MPGNITLTLDTRGFDGLVRSLSQISGKTYRDALRSETASVLKSCIRRTPSIQISKAIRQAQNKVTRKFNTYASGRAGSKDEYIAGRVFESAKESNPRISISGGKTWWRQDGVYHVMRGPGRWGKRSAPDGGRWSEARWKAFEAEEADRQSDLKEALADVASGVRRSRGLGKHSWYEAAEELGIVTMLGSVPSYVKTALPSNRRRHINAHGTEHDLGAKLFIKIVNSAPMLVGPRGHGAQILQGAIGDRLRAFDFALTKGVFRDVKARVSRFPGIFVKP